MSDGYPIDYFRCLDCSKKIVTDESAHVSTSQLLKLRDEVRNLKHELFELRKEMERNQNRNSELFYTPCVSIPANWHMDGWQCQQAAYDVQNMQEGKERRGGS